MGNKGAVALAEALRENYGLVVLDLCSALASNREEHGGGHRSDEHGDGNRRELHAEGAESEYFANITRLELHRRAGTASPRWRHEEQCQSATAPCRRQ